MGNLVIICVRRSSEINFAFRRVAMNMEEGHCCREEERSAVDSIYSNVGEPLCRTVLYKRESCGERLLRLRNMRSSSNIWMSRRTGDRLRKAHERKFTRLISDAGVTEHHSVSTKVLIVTRKNASDRGCVVYDRPVGKFRTTLRMKKKRPSVPDVDACEMLPESEEMVYEDIVLGKPKRVVKGRSGASNASITWKRKETKKSRRTPKRRVINLSQFRMFDDLGESRSGRKTSMVEDIGGQGTNEDVDTGSTCEREKFCKSLDLAYSCTNFLYNGWREVPFLRCCGGKRMKQKYVCVSTLRLNRTLKNGSTVVSVMFNLIIEEQSRKMRNVCIRREAGAASDMTESYLCSCHANWDERGMNDSDCWHVACVKENTRLMERVYTMLQCGLQP